MSISMDPESPISVAAVSNLWLAIHDDDDDGWNRWKLAERSPIK